jgi:hypothetical protein
MNNDKIVGEQVLTWRRIAKSKENGIEKKRI